jgi:hypothetical protein
MKRKFLMKISIVLLSSMSILIACNKDKDDDEKPVIVETAQQAPTLEQGYFTVDNAVFKSEVVPAASQSNDAPVIASLYGNLNVLEGGSNPISIETDADVKNILVAVEGVEGHYVIAAESLKSTQETLFFSMFFSQLFQSNSFVIIIAIENMQGLISAHETIAVTKIEAGTGTLQISCSWDKPNDIDLHLKEPNGEVIYFGNEYSENGGTLDVDSNPACMLDNINNENITYSSEAVVEAGEYIVYVDLFSNCYVEQNTNVIVTARYNGQIIATSSGKNPYQGSFNSTDVDFSEGSDFESIEDYSTSYEHQSGREIMRFVIPASGGSDRQNNESDDLLAQKNFKLTYSKPALKQEKVLKVK